MTRQVDLFSSTGHLRYFREGLFRFTQLNSYRITEFQNIFPTCENGEILDCQENKSNQTLDENCEKILMFTSENSTCSCRGSNNQKLNSKNIVREGWSRYIR